MYLATSNKLKRLLHLNYIGRVEPAELKHGLEDLKALLADLSPGFRLLADLSRLETMDLTCAAELGRGMELIDQRGVALVVRVIPDPGKDIGLNILTLFHYARQPRVVTCENIIEAAQVLSL
jgi:hypothetical protein